jgi:hypothetical protein
MRLYEEHGTQCRFNQQPLFTKPPRIEAKNYSVI